MFKELVALLLLVVELLSLISDAQCQTEIRRLPTTSKYLLYQESRKKGGGGMRRQAAKSTGGF